MGSALKGDDFKALMHYEEAIQLSDKHGFQHEEALACERAGIFCLEIFPDKSKLFLQKAYCCYDKWGAVAKLHNLIENYPSIFEKDNIPRSKAKCPLEDFELEQNSQRAVSVLSDVSSGTDNPKRKKVRFSA